MSFRIAAASSDGVDINEHFGHAGSFYIYEVGYDGSRTLLSINSPPAAEGSGELKRVQSGCGGGNGCGSGCHGGGNIPDLDISFLDGAKYVFAAKIGKGIEKALLKKGITSFSIETTIDEAVKKIVVYENRLNRFNGGK